MYPVGSLYFSTNSTSPATIYGGTWERYGKGRTLVSVDESDTDFTAGKTGGEKTHQHEYGWVVCDYYSSPLITPGSKNRTHSDSGLLSWDNEGHLPDKSWFFNWTQSQYMGNMEKNGLSRRALEDTLPARLDMFKPQSPTYHQMSNPTFRSTSGVEQLKPYASRYTPIRTGPKSEVCRSPHRIRSA